MSDSPNPHKHINPDKSEKHTLWVLSRDLKDLAKADAFGNFNITSLIMRGAKTFDTHATERNMKSNLNIKIPIVTQSATIARIKPNEITGDNISLQDIYQAVDNEKFKTSYILSLVGEDEKSHRYHFSQHKLQVKGEVYDHTPKTSSSYATCLKIDKLLNNKGKPSNLHLQKLLDIQGEFFTGKVWSESKKEGHKRETSQKSVCLVTGCELVETTSKNYRCVNVYG